jgi:hypothetical protein
MLRGYHTTAHALVDVEPRSEEGDVAWAYALVALEDPRTLPLLVELVDETLAGARSWEAVDVALDGVAKLGRAYAVGTFARLMAHPEAQLRFRAAEKLAEVDAAEAPLRWLSLGRSIEVRVAAAWGLVQLGHVETALRYVSAHGALLVPRFVSLGPKGVRALCTCLPELLGPWFEDAARRLSKKRQHEALLEDLCAHHSALARAALEQMGARARRGRVSGHGRFGDAPMTRDERADLVEEGIDPELLAALDEPNPRKKPRWVDDASSAPEECLRVEDALWRPPAEPAPVKRQVKPR